MKRIIISCAMTLVLLMTLITSGGLTAFAATSAMVPVGGSANIRAADISHWNTVTDWVAVKSNLDAIYIKATEGSSITDPSAAANANGALSVGLTFGFYEVFSPKSNGTNANTTDASAQADYFYNFIKQYPYSCVPVLDLEGNYSLLPSQVTADVKAFATEFKTLSGQSIMIYCDPTTADTYLDSSLVSYRLWLANPGNSPDDTNVWHKYIMWQNNITTGTVEGISLNVDLDKATTGIFIAPTVVYKGKLYTIVNFIRQESLSIMQRLSCLKITIFITRGFLKSC